MSRLFLFGTLLWDDLLTLVAGRPVAGSPARLNGWSVERAADGDWPVLVPGDGADGVLTEPLDDAARARLDWYETAFGYVPEAVRVGDETALAYRAPGRRDGAGEPWAREAWIARHGARTRLAAEEVMRARGRMSPEALGQRRAVIQARAHSVIMNQAIRRPVTVGDGIGAADIQVEAVAYPYEGFHRVEEWRFDHPRFDGGRSGLVQRAISFVTDAATVLPYDPVRDRVLVVEQVRAGALAKGDPLPWLLEPVAGLIDAGETAEDSALRELREEAGLTAGPEALRVVARYYPSPGGLAQVLHSFVALCDLPDAAAGLGGLEEENEDIRAHLIALPHLLEMVASGEAANAPLIVSAQWLALNAGALRLEGGEAGV
ncbi:MAG: NUDIX domain-containing protein [Pseudomonadota bacterium]